MGAMRTLAWALLLAAACGSAVGADVLLVEEVVNSGIGPQKTGARKTVKRIFIKGQRQRVESRIEATETVARQLRAQGQLLEESTLLQLDSARVYAIDPLQFTFVQTMLPGPKPVASATGAVAGPVTAAADTNREISFRTKALADTLRIQGILCKRVAAELRARHFQPGTRTVTRENRYLYQAWMATGFPGQDEIRRFQELQRKRTSYPSLLSAGLEQLGTAVDDGDRLATELDSLVGYPLESELKVFVKTPTGTETPLFSLTRRVTSLSYSALPDSLFRVTAALRPKKD